jgi:hypothetical protein
MSLLTLIAVLVAVLVALWLIGLIASAAGDPVTGRYARLVVLLIALLFVCQQIGLFDLLASVRFRF